MSRSQFIMLTLAAVVAGATLGALTAPASKKDMRRGQVSRELVVFETADCVYCRLFRRDVLPEYRNSGRSSELPIRFVDVNDAGPLESALSGPLTIVPTAVLLIDGREAGRITGYTGQASFQQIIGRMLAAN
ncbi:MAG TPA: thioredoxin fold domain-containing protein [Hyphomicrobiaceae bacterium]